jgi:diguanylate cyclase (GGDEF)-like protein
MTRSSVQRFRAAVLHMHLRIAVMISLPSSMLNYLFIETPDRGAVLFAFALFVLWLQWRTRHHSGDSQHYAGWFAMAILCVILYGVNISSDQMHLDVWMMIFPIAFAPIVETRQRIVWVIVGAVSFSSVMILRHDSLSPVSVAISIAAYLILGFITLMLVRHNEKNIEQLAHLSTIDPLTKAYNRGYMKEVLASEINRCRRNGLPLTIIMLDIDYFKMFNDNYGHLFGDSVLEQVADALRHAALRAGDYVFRYGGEEFCIVTSGLDREESGQFAEKLRQGVFALDIENLQSPHQRLTASAGFWCVGDLREIVPSALLLNADNALYRAKDAGRNTVVDFDAIPDYEIEANQLQSAPV